MGIFGTKNAKFGFGGRDDDFGDYIEDNGFEDEAEEEITSVEAPAAPAFTAAPLSLKIVAPKAYEDAKRAGARPGETSLPSGNDRRVVR